MKYGTDALDVAGGRESDGCGACFGLSGEQFESHFLHKRDVPGCAERGSRLHECETGLFMKREQTHRKALGGCTHEEVVASNTVRTIANL